MVKKMTKNIQYFFGVMSFSFARSQKINILWNPPAASFSPNLWRRKTMLHAKLCLFYPRTDRLEIVSSFHRPEKVFWGVVSSSVSAQCIVDSGFLFSFCALSHLYLLHFCRTLAQSYTSLDWIGWGTSALELIWPLMIREAPRRRKTRLFGKNVPNLWTHQPHRLQMREKSPFFRWVSAASRIHPPQKEEPTPPGEQSPISLEYQI